MQFTTALLTSLLLVLLLGAPSPVPRSAEPDRIEHQPLEVEGWTLSVDTRLLADGEAADTGKRALKLIRAQLVTIEAVLPAAAVARLREVKVVIDLDHELKNLQYHPGRRWLEDHGHDPALHKAVHMPDVGRFIDLVESNIQPWVLLHELSHAWHDQVLGFDDDEIILAWQRVRESEAIATVLHASGRQRDHYALTDPKEFFAEMSEAYFGTNDFYPFVRAELQHSDPATLAVIAAKWGVGESR